MQLVRQLVVMFRFHNNLNNKWLVRMFRAVVGKLRDMIELALYLEIAVFTARPNPIFALHFWVTRNLARAARGPPSKSWRGPAKKSAGLGFSITLAPRSHFSATENGEQLI